MNNLQDAVTTLVKNSNSSLNIEDGSGVGSIEQVGNVANGDNSIALGVGNTATSNGQIVAGIYSIDGKNGIGKDDNAIILRIGNGTSINRANCFTIGLDGTTAAYAIVLRKDQILNPENAINVDYANDNYLLKTAIAGTKQTVSGNVVIQGDLTVNGTTTSESQKQLLVEDNVIATNANKVDLQSALSGLAINKNATSVYGIMYDPTDDTVKFGEGTLDENNKFTFKTGEGLPIAIREDSTKFTNAHLVKWDATKKSFVDAGIDVASLSKKIKSLDLSYGAQVVTYDTADGMNIKSQTRITYSDDTTEDVNDEIEIPIVAGNGLNMDAITDNSKVVFKIDPEHSVYMATTPTAENAVPVYAKSSKSWISLPATPSASASSVVTRDANGNIQVGTPVNDADAVPKSFVESNSTKIGTSANDDRQLKAIYYMSAADIPQTPDIGVEYATVDLIGYSDLDSGLQEKIDGAATKTELSNAETSFGPAGTVVALSAPENATNGTLMESELASLQASDNASIMFNHKKYYLGGKGHQEGYLTYTHSGYENNVHILESITITISTRAWVLNATDVLDEEEIKTVIAPMIPTIPAAPTWQATAPTTEADKKKVQFTKVTINTTDDTNFPGMNGKYAIVPGFTNDGFHYGTVICSQADPAYEFPFVGSITSEMASGTVIKPSVASTYISVVDPAVTFTYEYLW